MYTNSKNIFAGLLLSMRWQLYIEMELVSSEKKTIQIITIAVCHSQVIIKDSNYLNH